MNFYQFIIPRLNGKDIEKNFGYYRGLVKKGIAGFIIFGGKLEIVRQGIRELQKEAERPLIIAADLERGLGQQLEGGTIFPPAMAIASAVKSQSPSATRRGGKSEVRSQKLLKDIFRAIALEAGYAGINTIFAPVLDINTNPKNPIISTRAFGEDAGTVSFFGCEMIRVLQANGIAACGKHFPGHGDTEMDSHIGLPLIKKSLHSLEEAELVPFKNAVKEGVKMIMLGHLKVTALDKSGLPVSLSEKAVKFLREKMKYKGILITDAMNMGGIGKFSEEQASLTALKAGVDLLLHPTDPDRVVSYLEKTNVGGVKAQIARNKKLIEFLAEKKLLSIPDFRKHRRISEGLAKKAIKAEGKIKPVKKPFLVILNDDKDEKGKSLISGLKLRHGNLSCLYLKPGDDIKLNDIKDRDLIIAIFSGIKAWKGGPSPWLLKCIKKFEKSAKIFISFGSPYILDRIGTVPVVKIYAYWDSDSSQKAVAEVL